MISCPLRRTASRTLTAGGWGLRSVVVFLLFLAWLVLAPAIPHIPPVNRVVLFVVVVPVGSAATPARCAGSTSRWPGVRG